MEIKMTDIAKAFGTNRRGHYLKSRRGSRPYGGKRGG